MHLADFEEVQLEMQEFPCMRHVVLPKLGTLSERKEKLIALSF